MPRFRCVKKVRGLRGIEQSVLEHRRDAAPGDRAGVDRGAPTLLDGVLGVLAPGRCRGRHGAGHAVGIELVLDRIEAAHPLSVVRGAAGVGVGCGVGLGIRCGVGDGDGEQFLLLAGGGGGVAVEVAAFEFVAGEGGALLQFAGAVEPVGANGLDALEGLDPGGRDGGELLGRGKVAFGQLPAPRCRRAAVEPGPPDDRRRGGTPRPAPARRAGAAQLRRGWSGLGHLRRQHHLCIVLRP